MTRVLLMKTLKVSYSRTKHPFIRLDDDDIDNGVGIDLACPKDPAYPKSYFHIDGYNLIEINNSGLYQFEDIGFEHDDIEPLLDVDSEDSSLKIIGVDII